MLGIGLREHGEFDIGGVTPLPHEQFTQILDLVRGQREAHLPIRTVKGGGALLDQGNAAQWPGFDMAK